MIWKILGSSQSSTNTIKVFCFYGQSLMFKKKKKKKQPLLTLFSTHLKLSRSLLISSLGWTKASSTQQELLGLAHWKIRFLKIPLYPTWATFIKNNIQIGTAGKALAWCVIDLGLISNITYGQTSITRGDHWVKSQE